MGTYTVQCSYAAYFTNVVTVEAESPEAACAKAVAVADNHPGWDSSDYCGETFVDAIASGDVDDPFEGGLAVPKSFTEAAIHWPPGRRA